MRLLKTHVLLRFLNSYLVDSPEPANISYMWNVASFFFIFVYMHIGRGLYYSSYKSPRVLVWSIGVIILILMIAIAFLSYDDSTTWFNNNNNLILNSMISSKIINNFIKDKNIKPVFTFENLEKQETREKVCKEIKYISGIYMILNKVTLDYYIGSTNRIYSRFTSHIRNISRYCYSKE